MLQDSFTLIDDEYIYFFLFLFLYIYINCIHSQKVTSALCESHWGYQYFEIGEQPWCSWMVWKEHNLAIYIEQNLYDTRCDIVPIYFDFLRITDCKYRALGYTAWLNNKKNMKTFSFISSFESESHTPSQSSYTSDIQFKISQIFSIILDEHGQYKMTKTFKLWWIWITTLWHMYRQDGSITLISYLCDNIARDARIGLELKVQIIRVITKFSVIINHIFVRLKIDPFNIQRLFNIVRSEFKYFEALMNQCHIKYNVINITGNRLIIPHLLKNIFHSTIVSIILQFLPPMQVELFLG